MAHSSGTQKRRRIAGRAAAIAAPMLAYIGAGSWLASSRLGLIMDSTRKKDDGADFEISTDPFDIDFRGDPGKAFGYAIENVMVPTELGDAPAWFIPGAGDTWAICVHGIGGVRENALRHLSVLQPAGIPTLAITYRNDRGAPSDPSMRYAFGLTEWRDLEAAVDYALAHGAKQVILDGESMGGAIVGQFLKESSRINQVVAVILDSPALDMRLIARNYVHRAKAPLPGAISTVGLWLTNRRFGIPVGTAHTIEAVARFKGPLFLAHGDGDTLVPIASSDEVLKARQGSTTFLRTNAAHIESWKEEPERYRTWLHGFLMTVLQRAPEDSGHSR